MAEHSFRLKGKSYTITDEDVERNLRGVDPEIIYELSAWVNSRWYPVKQAFAAAIGLTSIEVNSASAHRHLNHLGFPLWDAKTQGPRPEVPGVASHEDPSVRALALELAVKSANAAGSSTTSDIVAAADVYRAWLGGEG